MNTQVETNSLSTIIDIITYATRSVLSKLKLADISVEAASLGKSGWIAVQDLRPTIGSFGTVQGSAMLKRSKSLGTDVRVTKVFDNDRGWCLEEAVTTYKYQIR